MSDDDAEIAAAAARHGLSPGAGRALFEALVHGGGRMAQFSHPDLGGMGQWSGGMAQIGDMFNDALKAKVNAFCQEVSALAGTARRDAAATAEPGRPSSPWAVQTSARWWPAGLGEPSSSGSQNSMSYAFFPEKRRLALTRNGKVMLYDTGEHRLSGFSQQQPGAGEVSFSGQNGPVRLESFKVVDA
jgi:hypothetical protein